MAKALHAIDYLAAPQKHPPAAVNVVFGDEPFLRHRAVVQLRADALAGRDAEFSLGVFEGPAVAWPDVFEELSTVAMFGGGRRLVVVEQADDFVSRWRSELENYVTRPKSSGQLLLEVRSWPSNTRLYKRVAAEGLAIDCHAPRAAQIARWLGGWAKQVHGVELASAAAEMLVELVGPELGLLDQELARLALTTEPGGKITAPTVQQSVGSWRARTAWEMLDATLGGDAQAAITQLDRLLLAGEHPVGVLAQISSSLRRLAAATRLVLDGQRNGRRVGLKEALQKSGVRSFAVAKSERQLRHLGRHRGAQLYQWLLEADIDLKGGSALPPRIVLERLLLRLAADQREAASGGPTVGATQ